MFSYPFHIRDYLTKTRHLSPIEDLAYRRLLDTYYTEEKPLPSDTAVCARLIALRDHVTEVAAVLQEFFTPSDNGWVNERCDFEITKYHAKADSARKANQTRWQSKPEKKTDQKSNLKSDVVSDADQIATSKPEKQRTGVTAPDGVESGVWSDFVAVRKKRGALVTERVIQGIELEAKRAGISLNAALNECVVRGWQSFKADWYLKDKPKSGFDLDAELRGAL